MASLLVDIGCGRPDYPKVKRQVAAGRCTCQAYLEKNT